MSCTKKSLFLFSFGKKRQEEKRKGEKLKRRKERGKKEERKGEKIALFSFLSTFILRDLLTQPQTQQQQSYKGFVQEID